MDKSTEAYTKVNIPEALEMPEVHPKVQEQLDVIMGKMSSLEMLKGMQRR